MGFAAYLAPGLPLAVAIIWLANKDLIQGASLSPIERLWGNLAACAVGIVVMLFWPLVTFGLVASAIIERGEKHGH